MWIWTSLKIARQQFKCKITEHAQYDSLYKEGSLEKKFFHTRHRFSSKLSVIRNCGEKFMSTVKKLFKCFTHFVDDI